MSYRSQKNIIYKGEASIVNGSFSFSFVVPKDIAYYLGKGRISYYAISDNENNDAVGFDEDFMIGGTADDITYDYDGPEIALFMNTRQFISGGITDKNPVLLADVSDFSGINTVGNSIGHDIVVVLDGQTNNPLILNDYYKADKDNYKNGELLFPLADLSIGEHTLSLKIWDVFNNSSEATISFVVTDENEFVLTDFINYPNPFSSNTEFYFQHNQMAQNLDVTLEIYSITGSLVRTINNTFFDDGYRIGPIQWNGKDESANRLSAGMYIAQLKIQTENDFTFKSIRLILSPY